MYEVNYDDSVVKTMIDDKGLRIQEFGASMPEVTSPWYEGSGKEMVS